ncbi:MAG: arsenite methyltransferase [Dehalococcoidales bacterium]|jgi:SAM-dependent methyltransferase
MVNDGNSGMEKDELRQAVREGYGKIAQGGGSCCGPAASCGCADMAQNVSQQVGYSGDEIRSVPEGANLGLGCGNPVALASLKEGETVLDLGSGGGFDCFLAADRVGESGRVIGVDMTPEMLARARENARKGDYRNVEFRLGEIEHLPVADNSVDTVISNCVINLVPDKKDAFRETFRVLKSGGHLMISDIVLLAELPDFIKESIAAYVGCVSGAMLREEYLEAIRGAGFQDVSIIKENVFPVELITNDPVARNVVESLKIPPEKIRQVADSIISVAVSAVKP